MAPLLLKVSEAASCARREHRCSFEGIRSGGTKTKRESIVKTGQRERIAGVLLMAAGVAFYVAAALAHQIPFYGAGTALLGVGVAFLAKARKMG
jgi:hypothetical protein